MNSKSAKPLNSRLILWRPNGHLPHPVRRVNLAMRNTRAEQFVISAPGAVLNGVEISVGNQPRSAFVKLNLRLNKRPAVLRALAELRPADGAARARRAKICREQHVLRQHAHRADVMLETVVQRHNRAVGKERGEQIEVALRAF